ncbi:MAG: MarR family transcriptional regulator [Eubacteriales bacterium]
MKDIYRSIPSRVSSLRHSMNEYLVQQMRKAGWNEISPSHGGIIYALLKNEVLSMKEIAQRVKRDPSTVTTLVNKLVKLGYAEYKRNPDDMRSKQVSLTAKGKELYNDFNQISMELTSALVEGLDDSDIDVFMNIMKKMESNVNNQTK